LHENGYRKTTVWAAFCGDSSAESSVVEPGTGPLAAGLPVIQSSTAGLLLLISGGLVMLAGWFALVRYGKGLPMNAFPPQKLVTSGIYRYIFHPIYLGFSLLVAGASVYTASTAGLWIVTPMVILACAGLIYGYELIDLRERFGSQLVPPLIRFPADSWELPVLPDRLSVYVMVFLPWLILYEAVKALGPLPGAMDAYFEWERSLLVLEWTEMIYLFTYLFVLGAPLVAKRKRDLRQFMVMGIIAMATGILLFILLPFRTTPKLF
jgi:hypothetical protein